MFATLKERFVVSALGALICIATASAATTQGFVSPCPNIFMYETPGTEPGKWYGVVNITTDTTLYALWLNIVLESKADILGNWVGEVTTDDNIDFKIENTKMKISPGTPLSIRFFIQYNLNDQPPKLLAIRFNGREICNVNSPVENVEYVIPVKSGANVGTTTVRSSVTTTRSINRQTTKTTWTQDSYQTKTDKQQTTLKPQYWTQTKSETKTTTSKPQYWQETKVETHQIKSDKHQVSVAKDSQWPQAKVEDKSTTTASPAKPIWPHIKVGNIVLDTTNTGIQTKNPNGSQDVINKQATAQLWSQTYDTNNQQTKTQDRNKPEIKQPIKIDNYSKTRLETVLPTTTTQSSFWSQFNVDNKPTTKPVNKPKTKNDEKSQTTVKTPVWPNVETTNNQNVQSPDRYQGQSDNKSPLDDIPQTQFWPKITVGDVPTKPEKEIASSQQRRPVNSQQIKYNQEFPISSADEQEIKPIYVRPQNTDLVPNDSDDYSQIKLTDNSHQSRPVDTYNKRTDGTQRRPIGGFEIKPIKRHEDDYSEQAWSSESSRWPADRTQSEELKFDSGGTRYNDEGKIKNSNSRVPYDDYRLTTTAPVRVTAGLPDIEDFDNINHKKGEDSYYFGGLPTIYIPNHSPRITEPQCGKVYLNKDSLETLEGQWPWQIALYQQQTTVDFKYICGGTLVSRRHIITAAHCVTRKGSRRIVNKNTLTVYLGKYNLRTSVEGVQVKFVSKILIHPEYNATTFNRDLAVLELRESVAYTNWVQPACLWPEDEIPLRNIVGKRGSVVGWGFEVSGSAREELSLLEMPVVDQDTCISSYIDFYRRFTSDYTYCAGYRDGTSVCNGDSGGGMVFKKGKSWYLRGVASLSVARQGEYRCDPDHYVIFTDIAKMLPWIEDNIDDY